MQQLIITILALLSVIAPIAAGKLRRMVITPRLLKLFQHMFLTGQVPAVVLEAGISRADPDQFAGSPDWHKLLAYASSGRSFCIAFVCRLFPKQAAAI
jgi:acyl-CoA dehydrogenase